MADASLSLCGIPLKNPLILASGIMGMSGASMNTVVDHGAGAVTCKSIGPEERFGHKNPTVYAWEHGITNAVGLPNPGVDAAVPLLKEAKHIVQAPMIVSMFADTVDRYAMVAEKLSTIAPVAIEVNLSCPNTEKDLGPMFALDTDATSRVISAVKRVVGSIPVFAKLTPDAANIVDVAKAAEAAGADGITATNTISGLIIDIQAKRPILTNTYGGVSGPAIKPMSVRAVYNIYKAVKIPIIGTGGVTSASDAIEMMMAGATAVGIGSAIHYQGLGVFQTICEEIKEFMEAHGYATLQDIRGAVHR